MVPERPATPVLVRPGRVRRRAGHVDGHIQQVFAVRLPAEPASARVSRRLLVEQCAAWPLPDDLVDTAVLLTSELVTNAVLHGRSAVSLEILVSERCVRVQVGDDNSRHPQPRPAEHGALDGRGLHIVGLLADRWGVADAPVGKTVWFELAPRSGA